MTHPRSSVAAVVALVSGAACSSQGAANVRSDATDPPHAPSPTAASATGVPASVSVAPASSPAPTRCEGDGCRFDEAGACVVDTRPEGQRSHAPESTETCACVDGSCRTQPIERVPCKTVRDCWIAPSPRTHPIARPPSLRARDFAPCKDGEVAPACGTDGFCSVGDAFKC